MKELFGGLCIESILRKRKEMVATVLAGLQPLEHKDWMSMLNQSPSPHNFVTVSFSIGQK